MHLTADPRNFLGADGIIETDHPDIRALVRTLREGILDDTAFSAAAFEWVRDEVAHSYDAQDTRPTLTASEVLTKRVGLCYAKSHLLTAILRAGNIPAGLCYQRLRSDESTHVLHGLVAAHLEGAWHRLDPRGNKPGIEARFSLDREQLAYVVDPSAGEIDYEEVFVSAAPAVVDALASADNILTSALPSRL